MKKKKTAFRRLSEDQRKQELDRSTAYTTLLPAMNEGFHMGYRPVPGLQSDGNRQPHQWLESMARNMHTPGGEVGFAIPDVLAAEQQLRRLSRLPGELSMRHQEMLDFRALLALLLLWDELEKTPGCPELTVESITPESGGFAAMVLQALPEARAAEGLRLVVLTRQDGDTQTRCPLCLLSNETLLTPAADPEDMTHLLPQAVRWYDRQAARFTDPSPWLDEQQLAVLLPRLRLVMALCEDASLRSPLYDPAAQLCAPLGRFAEDLLKNRQPWREQLSAGDSRAEAMLRTRVQAVYGMLPRGGSRCRISARELLPPPPTENPLLRAFLPEGCALPPVPPQVIYTLDGVPFARQSGLCLLEPTGAAGESEALTELEQECALLDRYDPQWRTRMEQALGELYTGLNQRTGVLPCVPRLLLKWKQEYTECAAPVLQEALITYPQDARRMVAQALLRDKLGITDEEALSAPFSDCLVLIRGAETAPFGTLPAGSLTLPMQDGSGLYYFLPPISPAMARALITTDPAPSLPPERITARWTPDGSGVEVQLRLERQLEDGSHTSLELRRTYPLENSPMQGAAFLTDAASLPMVTVWPNLRLKNDAWSLYYVHTHRPGQWQSLVLEGDRWKAGESRTAPDGENGVRRWQTLQTGSFPAYVALKIGQLYAGVLPNDLPARRVRRDTDAAVGLDFGSISTTVMLRQGERIMPASLPKGIHGTLLRPCPIPAHALEDELIPPGALLHGSGRDCSFYSVMDMFSDEPDSWQRPLIDGHIYYPATLGTLGEKNDGTLYYDLKWSDEPYVMACLRLLLKQVMVQASLSARLHGSPSISWRISMPNAMPAYRQESYLNLLRGLAREVAQECGLPLTPGAPSVLYATENQAAGLYFRGRNEVSAQGGYLNLDLGGGTADISLWLNNAGTATAESSLPLGCRQLVFASVAAGHVEDFLHDFHRAAPELQAAASAQCESMHRGMDSEHDRQKCMLLMDDFFAAYPEQIRQALEEERARGGLAYTEALLLFGLGFLFYLCGVMLKRAAQNQELLPHLPARMELCIAGNGGRFLTTIDSEARGKLCQLTLKALPVGHPLQVLLPVQSREPKREVASGLLSNDGMLLSALGSVEKWNATFPEVPVADRPNLLREYLLAFIPLFPQAAEMLLGGLYHNRTADGAPALMPSAEMELATIFENEILSHPDDDLTAAVRCLATVRRLWEI